MSETALLTRPETFTHHPEWHMDARRGGFETEDELKQNIARRVHILKEGEPATEGPVVGFLYSPDDYDTHIELRDEYGVPYNVDLPLMDFLYSQDDESRDSKYVRSQIEADITQTCINKTRADGWWLGMNIVKDRFEPGYFDTHMPREQLIVGQEGRGVRFFNYADEALPESRVQDCQRFINLLTQFFGDRTYDLLTDVVIVPFDQDRMEDEHNHGGDNTNGFTHVGLDGVMFIDARLLDESIIGSSRLNDEPDTSEFLGTLVHEYGHLLHGSGDEAEEGLLAFAREVGWDVDRMVAEVPNWMDGHANLREYAPLDDVIVTHDDGSQERMPYMQYLDEHDDDYDDDGNKIREGKPFIQLGSPTGYGEKQPTETFADTTKLLLLGDYVTRIMPETRDAWLAHAQRRTGAQPLGAVAAKRPPIITDRRTGDDILYPVTPLPDMISVRVKAAQGRE